MGTRRDDPRPAARGLAGGGRRASCSRLAFGLGYWVDKPLTHDEREYLLLARNVVAGPRVPYIAAGRRARCPASTSAARRSTPCSSPASSALTPGRSPARRRPDDRRSRPRTIRVVQAVLGGALVWLVGLARRAGGGPAGRRWPRAGWPPSIPPLVWTPAFVWSETLFSVLALRLRGRPHARAAADRGRYPAAGALAGLAVLTRPAMLFFLPLAALWLAWRREWRGWPCSSSPAPLVVAPVDRPEHARRTAASCSSPPRAASRSGPATTRWPSAKATWPRTRN